MLELGPNFASNPSGKISVMRALAALVEDIDIIDSICKVWVVSSLDIYEVTDIAPIEVCVTEE